jgi:NADH-quinone oxidoreductase subunit G
VPFYAGLTLEEIGGRGVRWPLREQAAALPRGETAARPDERPAGIRSPQSSAQHPASPEGATGESSGYPDRAAPPQYASIDALRLGTYRPIWASPEVEISPALKFAVPEQLVELSPEDARRLGIGQGETVQVAQNGTRLLGRAHVRSGVPKGTAFLAEGVASESANALTEPLIEVSKRAG